MKDPSSPMDVCPFCGKAFKRLKSHLPHCKMAGTKDKPPNTDHGDKSVASTLVARNKSGAVLPNPKVKGKAKAEGLRNQLQQEKSSSVPQITQPKVGKMASGNRLTALPIESPKEAPQTMTSQMVSSVEAPVSVTETNVPIQQALILSSNVERTLPANVDIPRTSNTMQTERVQDCNGTRVGDWALSCLPEKISEHVQYIGAPDHFQGQFQKQVQLDQSTLAKSLSGSTKSSGVLNKSTSPPEERVRTKVPGSIEAEMYKIKETGKSMEIKMNITCPPKMPPFVDGPLGLQWVPQLYSCYVQLGVIPRRQDHWDLYGRRTETPKPNGSQSELYRSVGKESLLENQSTHKRLMDVRLGELPAWLANRTYSPQMIPRFIANAGGRYYDKYINVKRGGVGGLTMLLAGYCVLSYSWNYNHIKEDRWRKYH